jgi:hypothetical protein
VAHADATLPIEHLVWQDINQEVANSPKCLFVVEGLVGSTFHLCSTSAGDYILAKKDVATCTDGLIASLTEDMDAATRVTMTVEGNTIRLAGPKRQQLSCISLTNDYDILATRSILPSQGLFVLHRV